MLVILVAAIGVAGGWLGGAIGRKLQAEQSVDEYDKAVLANIEAAAKIQSVTGAYALACDKLEWPNEIYVDLRKVKTVDSALKAIANHPQVGQLVLEGTDLTDAGMKYVAAFPRLQRLGVYGTQVSDAGVKDLEELTHLESLELGRTKVTDAGLKHLGKLHKLEFLSLSETAITDEGLKSLKGLSHLEELDISSTKATDAGVADLQKALPKCSITH